MQFEEEYVSLKIDYPGKFLEQKTSARHCYYNIIYKIYSPSHPLLKRGWKKMSAIPQENPSRLAIKSNSNFIHYKLPSTYKTRTVL